MVTIRVRDWTKERIEEIQERESHSSHDSVIKSLLKDHELAKFAGGVSDHATETAETPTPAETRFEDLTVFAEMEHAENGVLFLWCPSCGNEIAHLTVENPVSIPVFEMECQRCLANLDQHAIVAIEIGYPLEERLVDDSLHEDLQACVVDYWDRTLRRCATGSTPSETTAASLVWEFGEYVTEFGWEWPPDVPVVGIESGQVLYDEREGVYRRVLERASENRDGLDAYRVDRYESDPDAGTTELLDAATLTEKIVNRDLVLAEDRITAEQ